MRKLIPTDYSEIINPHVFSLKKQKAKGYISGYEQENGHIRPCWGSNEGRQWPFPWRLEQSASWQSFIYSHYLHWPRIAIAMPAHPNGKQTLFSEFATCFWAVPVSCLLHESMPVLTVHHKPCGIGVPQRLKQILTTTPYSWYLENVLC